ncbi:MAG: TRAP transporter substrate-binding protein DctP [Xanthomonadales bacterium]|jgi:TRAP-type C4-dicarboxylate transport system substrate-binding protein|nr:TRAP transporter substrate-binding protein DctP [Xanthomonadales bacterium]
MLKFSKTLIALTCCLAVTAGLWPSSARAATTLKIATVIPDGTDWMSTMREGIAEIDQRTEGRVKIKIYGGGVQGNDAQIRRKMRVGQLHGGVFTSGGLRAFQKDAELYGLPRLFRNYDEVAYVRERMDEDIYRRLEESGFITFGYAGGGFAHLVSNSPVRTQEDLRGIKLWIPEGDRVAQLATEAMRVSPVSLPITDVLTGLQTDLIDTVMGPPVGVIVMQWHTAMSYITDLKLAYIYAGLLIDRRPWSKIAPEDQAVVREVMERIYRGFDAQGVTDDQEAMDALLNQGLELVTLEDAERESWDRLFMSTNEAAAEAGTFDEALLQTLECHLAVFRGEQPEGRCGPGAG